MRKKEEIVMKLEHLKRIYTERIVRKKILELRSKSQLPIIVFICTPIHGNLGDQAIVYAQYNFFEELGLKDRILELTDPDYYRIKDKLPRFLNEKDIIVIDGGGNIGSLWPREDEIIREVICNFSKNKIFIFPQTAFYSEDSYGIELKQKMKKALSNAKNVIFFCRDVATFDIAKNVLKIKSYLVPDIVMTLKNIKIDNKEKECVLVCLREDREVIKQKDGKKELIYFLEKNDIPLMYSSTVIEAICRGNKNRKELLYSKWNEFSKAEVVITDRLHGMIFSAILGIPCIVFDNKSHKVFNGYNWLSELPYIKIAKNKEEAIESFKFLYQTHGRYNYINQKVELEFEKMKEIVKNEIE